MEWETFERIKPILPSLHTLHLSGLWGEVFIHPDLYEAVLREAKKTDITVYTISNGILIDNRVAEMIVKNRLNFLTISMDAATPETYLAIRKADKFQTILDNIERIIEFKDRYGTENPHLKLAFCGMKRNIREFPDFIPLAHRLNVKTVLLQAMGEYEGVEGESIFYRDRELGRKYYLEAKKIADELGVTIALFPPDQFDGGSRSEMPSRCGGLEEPEALLTEYNLNRKECELPFEHITISTNGDVLSCCSATKVFGNILQEDVKKIWYNAKFSELRETIRSQNPPKMCVYCTGMGWYKPQDPQEEIRVGENAAKQLGMGWHSQDETAFGRSIRWTQKKATLFLKRDSKKHLALEVHKAALPKSGSIRINGKTVGSFRVETDDWQTVTVPIPEGKEEVLKVDIEVDRCEREGGDPRTLGVAFHRAGSV
jgi:radical SAM protein with 4Fe4S-binding SPASM domain